MKKIKGILLFGILTLLGIGSSFASYNANQSIIHLRGTSPSDISIGSYFGHSYGSRYYYYAPGVVAGSSLQYFDNCPVYESGGGLNMVYYSGGGFDINYYCGGNGTTGKFYTIPPFSVSFAGTEIVGQMFINYYNLNDIYPLVFDYSYNYFTFSNDYQLTYNGVSYYNIDSTGQFGYCFYGYSDSISCVYRLSSTDFEFHYFQNLFGNITEEKGYILTPLYGTNKTFVFSYDSQNRLIYNIFSGVSDFVSDFENYELIDKGYIDTQALNFLYRALIGTDHYGSFARLSLTDSGLILSSNILVYPGTSSNGVINKAFGSSSPISLQSDNSVSNILGGNGGNGNQQSTGSIAINTGLLNLCLNDLQFGELNSYLCNRLLSNLGNPVQIPGTSGQYISVSIDENGNLRYWITTQDDLAEQMSGFVWVENEDGSRSTVCPSGDCLGTILAKPIIHTESGEVFEFTTGDVLDMMSNLTGWVGRCPFPYTDFRLGKNLKLLQLLQDYGFEYDPFIIVNCSVAGFQYGRHTIDNTLFGDTFEYPLLYGDTGKHRSLFAFLDFVVILGLFGLFAFLKKIF